ncbi:MAG: CGNR zinc finger domain-containing protein [Renibacterium sp.]|nr:CGNR zinc finger domain-containing protein [Renibacterium sp.]
MVFAHDTEDALRSVAALVNTGANADSLRTLDELDEFVQAQQYTGSRNHDAAELRGVRALRSRLAGLWSAPEDVMVQETNAILREAKALPQLVKHDGLDWHLHATAPEAELAVRIGVEAAMALTDVVRAGELARLRICAAEDCHAVVLDLSKNRSRRFCDTGNCANRTHVAAYRARKASA